MKRLMLIGLLLMPVMALAEGQPDQYQRYVIKNCEYIKDGLIANILLDTKTGKSWMLFLEEGKGASWWRINFPEK